LHLTQEAFWFLTRKSGWVTEPGNGNPGRIPQAAISACAKIYADFRERKPPPYRLAIEDVIDDEAGHGVLAHHFGGMLETPMIQMGREMSLEQISKLIPEMLTPEQLRAINDDLAKAS
jgi:hypothetical protein